MINKKSRYQFTESLQNHRYGCIWILMLKQNKPENKTNRWYKQHHTYTTSSNA